MEILCRVFMLLFTHNWTKLTQKKQNHNGFKPLETCEPKWCQKFLCGVLALCPFELYRDIWHWTVLHKAYNFAFESYLFPPSIRENVNGVCHYLDFNAMTTGSSCDWDVIIVLVKGIDCGERAGRTRKGKLLLKTGHSERPYNNLIPGEHWQIPLCYQSF